MPVAFVTNGVHVPTWMSLGDRAALRALPRTRLASTTTTTRRCGTRVAATSRTRNCGARARRCAITSFTFVRERARQRWSHGARGAAAMVAARNDARSERADDRLRAPLHHLQAAEADLPRPAIGSRGSSTQPGRPVQFVFAGKAHPADDAGKELSCSASISQRARPARSAAASRSSTTTTCTSRTSWCRACDVWLNNPRKPLEASGTSGMKAAINGAPHLSIGDGWWAEGYTGKNGWLIEGAGAPRRPGRAGCGRRRGALHLLESRSSRPSTIATRGHAPPLAAGREGVDPHRAPRFSARRMVKEYVERCTRRRRRCVSAVSRSGSKRAASCRTPPACPWLKARCALCGAKEVSEPRGDERYCRDCWDKKIAVEEIVAREFALKRYIRAHSAEKYLDLPLDASSARAGRSSSWTTGTTCS